MDFEIVRRISLYPVLDLDEIKIPEAGVSLPLPNACSKNYLKSDDCKRHYEALLKKSEGQFQCPHGFSTHRFKIEKSNLAITSYIPFPRVGGKQEKDQADKNPGHRVPVEAVSKSIQVMKTIFETLNRLGDKTIRDYSMALHEIRKLNRTVKQTAERLHYNHQIPPDEQRDKLLQIWKTSELMSSQFDVVEIVANERLAELPLQAVSEIYRLVDKCVKIYQTLDNRVNIFCPSGYFPKVRVCDKTVSIIPTSLIENAIKFSKNGTPINVNFEKGHGKVKIKVENISDNGVVLTNSIFEKGNRADNSKEGSGFGLYVAQLVATQHNTAISISSIKISEKDVKNIFSVEFQTVE